MFVETAVKRKNSFHLVWLENCEVAVLTSHISVGKVIIPHSIVSPRYVQNAEIRHITRFRRVHKKVATPYF